MTRSLTSCRQLTAPFSVSGLAFRQCHDDALSPQAKRTVGPGRPVARHDRHIDGIALEGAKQPRVRPVERLQIDLGKAPMIFGQRCMQISGGERGVDADCKPTVLASTAAFQVPKRHLGFFENPASLLDTSAWRRY
jgi:hypothetical protein